MNISLAIDAYKLGHRVQYEPGTSLVYSNWTPRGDTYLQKLDGVYDGKIVWLGLAHLLNGVLNYWEDFFDTPWGEIRAEYSRIINHMGFDGDDIVHLKDLHDLGYLPIKIKALPEGSIVPIGTPCMTVYNTDPAFFWVTNYLEDMLSTEMWKLSVNATIARQYRILFDDYASKTSSTPGFVDFQGHDFSLRGMSGLADAAASGTGHLLFFKGTDNIPAVARVFNDYAVEPGTLVGTSVPATEHSVMMMGRQGNEFETFKRLITETHPTGIVSIVSDTWNLWQVVTNFLPRLKNEILARDGKVVIRPDSGDPANILCGSQFKDLGETDDPKAACADFLYDQVCEDQVHGELGDMEPSEKYYVNGRLYHIQLEVEFNRYDKQYYFPDGYTITSFEEDTALPSEKGLIRLLWDTFDGTTNDKGYRELDPHVGAIYGDSITLDRAQNILERLKTNGFASTNVVLGIGSYTYNYSTRDSLGWAMKATAGIVNGEVRLLQKDPVTDTSGKKSRRGFLRVERDFTVTECETLEEAEKGGLLRTFYQDGVCGNTFSWEDIRARANN